MNEMALKTKTMANKIYNMKFVIVLLFFSLNSSAQMDSSFVLLNNSIIGIYDCEWRLGPVISTGHFPHVKKTLSINANNLCRVTVEADDGYKGFFLGHTCSGTWALNGDTLILVFIRKVYVDQMRIEKFICRNNELTPLSFEPKDIKEQPITAPYTKMGWSCISIHKNMAGIETSAYYPNNIRSMSPVGNLYFIEDSVWSFEYPCQMLSVNKIYMDTDTIYIAEPNQQWKCKLQNDTLIRVNTRGDTEKYLPMHFDKNILQDIHSGIINPSCITGSWNLKTYQEVEFDNGFDIIYPIKLPNKISLNAKSIVDSKNRIIQFSVEGVSRKFHVYQIIPHTGELILTPLNWWKGEAFSVYYINEK